MQQLKGRRRSRSRCLTTFARQGLYQATKGIPRKGEQARHDGFAAWPRNARRQMVDEALLLDATAEAVAMNRETRYECIAGHPILPRAGRARAGCPRPMRRGWLRRNRRNRTLRHFHRRREGILLDAFFSPLFYGEVSERRPWALNATRRPKGAKFFAALPAWIIRMTTAKPRNSAGNSVRISGGKERDPLQQPPVNRRLPESIDSSGATVLVEG